MEIPDRATTRRRKGSALVISTEVLSERALGRAIGLARGPVMRYFETMQTVNVEIPTELVLAAGLDTGNLSAETARYLALGLYREDKVSLGRAAELCQMPVEPFMEYAAQHNVPLHYDADDLEEDRRTLERLGL